MISGPRYLDERYRGNSPRFLGAQQQPPESSEDKGSADVNEEIEVQGLAIPAHGEITWRRCVAPRIAAQKPGRSPTLQGRAGSRLRSGFDLDGDGYRRDRCGGDVRHPGPADSVS